MPPVLDHPTPLPPASIQKTTSKIYPPYCHDASSTLSQWCPYRVTDLYTLKDVGMMVPEAPGSSKLYKLFHHTNHPVKWVKIIGVIVAVDEFTGRRVYTIDDSSGECVECSCILPPAAGMDLKGSNISFTKVMHKYNGNGIVKKEETTKPPEQSVDHPNVPYELLDVGSVIKVKGRVGCFRDVVQVEVVNATVVKGTEVEVKFWDEARRFKEVVLGKEWVLSEEKVEELRRKDERRRKREFRKVREGGEKVAEGKVLKGRKIDSGMRKTDVIRGRRTTSIQDGRTTGVNHHIDDRNAAKILLEQEILQRTKRQQPQPELKRWRHETQNTTHARIAQAESSRKKEREVANSHARQRYPSLAVRKAAAGKYDLLGI